MIKITVPALPVRNMKGVSTKANGTAKPYDFNVQTIYCHVADQAGQPLPFPEKSEITLFDGAAPYAAGEYTLSPDSLYVDRQGRLGVSPRLVPLKARAS